MLRNKRKYPYILALIILISAGALAFLEIRGIQIRKPDTAEYYPLVSLNSNIEGSEIQYKYNDALPFSYSFSHLPYQADIYQTAYTQVGEGVAGKISDSAYLYIGEYDGTITTGLTKVLDELPTIVSEEYNRNGSYITPKATNTGYINKIPATNTFAVITVAKNVSTETEEYFICVLDIVDSIKQKGMLIASLVDGSSDSAKDYAKELVETVAYTLRENHSFTELQDAGEKVSETETEEDESSYSNLVAKGVQIEVNKPNKDKVEDTGNKKEDTNSSEPVSPETVSSFV